MQKSRNRLVFKNNLNKQFKIFDCIKNPFNAREIIIEMKTPIYNLLH